MKSFSRYLAESKSVLNDDEKEAVSSSRMAGNFSYFDKNHANYKRHGFSQDAIDGMDKAYDKHRIDSRNDDEIVHHLRHQTPTGKLMIHHSDMEHEAVDHWLKTAPDRHSAEMKSIRDEHEFMGGSSGFATPEDMAADRGIPTEPMKDITLYRKGRLDHPIQSWTTNPRGAWMGNAGHIGHDHKMTYSEAHARGYRVLGGFMRMMGSPGESEITLAHMPSIHKNK